MTHIQTLENLTHQDVINLLQDSDIERIVSLLRSGNDHVQVIAHIGEYETFYGHFTFQVDDVEITVECYDNQHVVLY